MRVEPIGRRALRVRLHLEGGDPLEVALETWERCGPRAGDRLDRAHRHALLSADAEVRVRDAALNLLSYRARTRSELSRRLRAKGFEEALVGTCVQRLSEQGIIDDAAVSTAFVRDRLHHRPRGRVRLQAELRAKGVSAPVAQEAISRVFDDEGSSDRSIAIELAEGWVTRQGRDSLTALAPDERTKERDRALRRLRGYLVRRGLGGEALSAGIAHAIGRAREATD